jgi:Ca2+-binding RTX toxin-like protein
MSTIKVTSTAGSDFDDFELPGGGTIGTHTPTAWHLDYAGGAAVDYTGTGFKFDGGNSLIAGTITGFTWSESKTEKFQVTGLSLDAAVLTGAANAADFLGKALAGNDTITGGAGNDHLLGFDGNDTIDGGKGNDAMEGGAGNDIYVVDSAADTITEVSGTDTAKIGTNAVTAAYAGVENYIFTGAGNWTFTGNTLGNAITGGAGNDTIFETAAKGAGGDDTLSGGKGNDTLIDDTGSNTLNGDDGNDTLQTLGTTGNDTLLGGAGNDTLQDGGGTNTLDGGAGDDVILAGKGADTILGGDGNDNIIDAGGTNEMHGGKGNDSITLSGNGDNTITGDDGDDVIITQNGKQTLSGNAGNDVLIAGTGADTLDGGDGNDVLNGRGGGDTLIGGKGNDIYDIRDGSELITELAGQGTDAVRITTALLTVDMNIFAGAELENVLINTGVQGVTVTGNALNNVMKAEVAGDGQGNDELHGGDGNDTLDGRALDSKANDYNDGDNDLFGDAGADTLIAGSGNDSLDGGTGKDTMTGGAGNDSYVVDDLGDKVTELVGQGSHDFIETAVLLKALVANVEDYQYTGTGDWTFTGGKEANILTGGSGNDTLAGGGGADTLVGGDGNDTYIAESDDTVTEKSGGGIDTIKTADLALVAVNEVENYIFTGKGNWTFVGNALGNAITGGAGNDNLSGGVGSDILDGGKGIDTFDGGSDADTYILDNIAELKTITDSGGAADGIVASFAFTTADAAGLIGTIENFSYNGTAAWTFSLAGNGDTHVLSGGKGIDTLTGGSNVDVLYGNDGNDLLDGGANGDLMTGGLGNDTYVIDNAADQVFEATKGGTDTLLSKIATLNLAAGSFAAQEIENVTVQAGVVGATVTGNTFNNVLTGNENDDTLKGGGGNDTLTGNDGNDTLDGGVGKDVMTGGKGNDTYTIDDAGDKVTELAGQGDHDLVKTSIALKAVIANIEDYTYTGADAWTFTGSKDANVITGGDGNDVLAGGGGADTLAGGKGNDTYTVDADDTVIEGSNAGIDTVITAETTFTQIANVENYIYTGKAKWDFTGNALDNAITGGALDDKLTGGDGDDVLDGGKGNDTLDGGLGNDTYILDSTGDVVVTDIGGSNDTIQTNALITGFVTGIESYTYTGKANWTFTGDTNANTLIGGSGNDVLNGADGADTLKGGLGNDTLDGGAGDDTAVFSGLARDYHVVFGVGTVTVQDLNAKDGNDGVDTLKNIEHVVFADGPLEFAMAQITGINAGDDAGFSVSGAGDVNGDGFADFIIGGQLLDGAQANSGGAFILFGGKDGLPDTLALGDVDGTNGVFLKGGATSDFAGISVSAAGDVNGDGFDDVIVAAPGADGTGKDAGEAYVVFGSGAAFPASIDLSALGSKGFTINGDQDNEQIGTVASGDFNGDGFADLVIGAYNYGTNYSGHEGAAFIVFGSASPTDVNLASPDGTHVVRINGNIVGDDGDDLGFSASSLGDINGDGIDDLILGSPYNAGGKGFNGVSYVLFGQESFDPTLSVADLDGKNGFALPGLKSQDFAGWAVSGGGDLNGDGFDDLVIGAIGSDPHGSDSGTAYVVFGHAGSFAASFNLGSLNGTTGFKLSGIGALDYAGGSVSLGGDFNGDGFADILIGAGGDIYNSAAVGKNFIIFGHAGTFSAGLELANLSVAQGIEFDTPSDTGGGWSVSWAGDTNGDGYDDLIIGENRLDSLAGGALVIYGGDVNISGATLITGGAGDDTKNGTTAAEIINGAQGNDTLSGGGGHDAIEGGSGNDHISVADNTFNHVDGGGGFDTLSLDYGGAIDFANIDGNAKTVDHGKITSIELIDVDNGQANALTLHLADVLDIAPQDANLGGKASLDNVLQIDGNVGDSLKLFTGDGWDAGDTGILAGYKVFDSGGVKVAVDLDITVTVSPT